jgi:putative ABC transport system ATP-binding protein
MAIEAQDLVKAFGAGTRRMPVVRDVSLEVAAGQIVFLVGPSGSGKTTLLSILGCLLRPDAGKVEVLGREITRLPPQALTDFRREHVGFVFQTFNLFPTLSALDNVSLALAMRGQPRAQAVAQAAAALAQVGLAKRAHLRPAQLSTGECQRVAVARALATNPALLFADEPTASLDAENGQTVMLLLTELVRRRGTSLVVVTHDKRIYSYADRILYLEDGLLTHSVNSADLKLPAGRTPLPDLFKECVA